MQRLSTHAIVMLVFSSCAQQSPAQEQETPQIKSPFKVSSQIEAIQGSGPFLRLKNDGRKLVAEYEDAQSEYKSLINDLRTAAGSSGSGSSTGPRVWAAHFNGDKMMGKIGSGDLRARALEFGFAELSADGFAVQIIELEEPFSKLKIKADRETDELTIRYSRHAGEFVFRLQQKRDRQMLVQMISSDEIFSELEPDFATFAIKHGGRLDGPIRQLLMYLGVEPPLAMSDPKIREHVLEQLRPHDADKQNAFNDMIQKMTAGKFDEREAASQTLNDEFAKWKSHIYRAANDSSLDLETRSRLRKLIESSTSPIKQMEFEILLAAEMENDPEYLVGILEEAALSQNDRQHVVKHLEKIAGKPIGNAIDDWKQWLDSNRKPVPKRDYSRFGSQTPVVIKGPLDGMHQEIADLVPLKIDSGVLQLNRNHWSKIYGDRQSAEIVEQLQQHLKKNRLPASWLNFDQIYDPPTIGYPQILFDVLKSKGAKLTAEDPAVQDNRHLQPYQRVASHSRNRDFDFPRFFAKLMLHKDLPRQERKVMVRNGQLVRQRVFGPKEKEVPPVDADFFRLSLMEKSESQRSLLIYEDPDGYLSIRIEIGKSNAIISLSQFANQNGGTQVRLTDVRGADIFIISANSFQQLMDNHKEYFETQFIPLLESLGLTWQG